MVLIHKRPTLLVALMVGGRTKVIQVVADVNHHVITRGFDGIKTCLLVGGIRTQQHGFFIGAGKAQTVHIVQCRGVFAGFAIGHVEHRAAVSVDIISEFNRTGNGCCLAGCCPLRPGLAVEWLVRFDLPRTVCAVIEHGFIEVNDNGFLLTSQRLRLIESHFGRVKCLISQRLIFTGLLEPVQCHDGLIVQLLLGIGFLLRTATEGQHD
ncbi:hypothetical protein SRABI106_04156 [Rahnella aquatilis]|nr:hypothetical protein SRABI106_04156 [Rahnella aquatilis]